MYSLLTAAVLLSSTASTAVAGIITPDQILPSYDFVIAGGGLAGLVIASRLTEDQNKTVLVIEAGDTGDAVRARIDVPTAAYFNGLVGTSNDWQYLTEPQANLGGRNVSWPRGKVLGGSSAVNGMYMVRPSAKEMDYIEQLQNGQPGATAWGWASMFLAMKKSETFTPPAPQIQTTGNILYDQASHGSQGPLHTSYPGFLYPIVGDWQATLSNIGIPTSPDPNGGAGWGAFIATSSINPTNWTRSYSRSAYIDPLPPRSNLHILANQTVTKIIFQQNGGALQATAVEYANSGYQPKPWPTVGVGKEVLLAAGAVGSPNILMQSGVGPADKLQAAGVQVAHALPGVGQHVQDHISTQVAFKTNAQTAATLYAAGGGQPYPNGTNNPEQSFINSAIAYSNITDLLGSYASTLHDQIVANLTAFVNDRSKNPSADPAVTAGYQAIYKANADMVMSQIGQVELLLSLTGTAQGGAGSFAVQAALQHPFSQGQLYISTSNPFDYPKIDPGYFSHPADIVMLREGIKLARKIGETAPLNGSVVSELSPGPTVSTDDQWDGWLRSVIGTEYHPSCTCAMLPLEQGGVVDPTLKVYGLANVRVTDSSVFPIQFAAHLMAPTYGLAEQAADIIKSQYNGTPSPAALQTQTGNPATRSATETTARQTGTPGVSPDNGKPSAALPSVGISWSLMTVLAAGVGAFFTML
ncbi:hypothetical protein FRB99_008013 [Tulasnella sp. 403]|nr:hypothetical protein FRB99_008013 [Tulasnella sp. 403]